MSDEPPRLGELLEPVLRGEAAVTLAIRAGAVKPGAMPWHQRLGNTALTSLIRLVSWCTPPSDLQSFEVIHPGTLQSLALRERWHGWTAEMVAKAALRGLTIVEVETGRRRRLGRSKVSGTVRGGLLAGFGIFSAIIRIWIADRRPSASSVGAAARSLVSADVLAFASVSLLTTEGSTYRALVAVWLWALRVLGAPVIVGYLAGAGWIRCAVREGRCDA